MIRLGVALGANTSTFNGLSGLGDLVLTCSDDLSRNRQFGKALASGSPCLNKSRIIRGFALLTLSD
jgi:glycerol-3-phosphate dehydrogenase